MKRIAIIGAGPIGIAAALEARARGHETTVLEAGDIGASLLQWGATRFFTPLSMNATQRMLEQSASPLPPDSILTGPEYVNAILRPLAAQTGVRTRTRVVSVTRRGLTRTDYAGHPLRAEKPFRLLTSDDELIEADVVLDATGSSAIPLPFAARGESGVAAIRTLGELHERKEELRGRRVLVIGHGHSAANAIPVLRGAGAEVVWAVRTSCQNPCEEIANDPLPERRRVVAGANALTGEIRVERRASVERVARNNGSIEVTLSRNRSVSVDAIVAMTGYRPSSAHTAELPLEISPVNEGGARLYRAISNITDCLCTPAIRKEDLESGEPDFYFIGARAYGRSRTFLLQTGFRQVETILDSLR